MAANGPGRAGRGGGAKDQTSAASPAGNSAAARALASAASILARLRTMPASASSRATSASPNAATFSMAKPANAARNAGRLRRMVSQDRPDWKASRVSRSYRPSSVRTARPHSSSWYGRYSGALPPQRHRDRPSPPTTRSVTVLPGSLRSREDAGLDQAGEAAQRLGEADLGARPQYPPGDPADPARGPLEPLVPDDPGAPAGHLGGPHDAGAVQDPAGVQDP